MMMTTSALRRSVALLLGAATLTALPLAAPSVSAQAAGLGAGGEYFPVTPARIYENEQVKTNSTVDVPVVGLGGVPNDGVLAVAVNVTIAKAAGLSGYVSVRPSDYDASQDEPTSLINFKNSGGIEQKVVPNFTIVGVGSEGKIKIEVVAPQQSGDVRVLVDVVGWVAKSAYSGPDAANGARMETVTPERFLDTRSGAKLGPNASIKVPIRGRNPVPGDSSVTAVVVNITGVGGSEQTYLAASAVPFVPTAAVPEAPASTGNYGPGVNKANLAIVPINTDGSISIFNRFGNIHVLVDVMGYLKSGGADDTRTGRIVPLESPFRSFDTRQAEFNSTKLGFSAWEDWSFKDFAGSVTLNGAPVGAQAGLFGNLTATGLERINATVPVKSFLTLFPSVPGGFKTAPATSNVNFGEGSAVANTAVVTYGTNGQGDDNMISAYNGDGRTHYMLDVYAVVLD